MEINPTANDHDAPEPLLDQAPESERSDAFSIPISASEGDNSARQGFNCVQNFAMSGKGAAENFLSSPGDKSVGQDLDNLDINLEEMDHNGMDRQHSDLLISEIRDDNLTSSKKDAADDMEEMEKLLKSGGAFGGKELGDTFKKIRGEIQLDDFADNESDGSKMELPSAQKSGNESELDMNNSKMMESPGQNTLVMNQINQLTVMDSRGADLHAELQ